MGRETPKVVNIGQVSVSWGGKTSEERGRPMLTTHVNRVNVMAFSVHVIQDVTSLERKSLLTNCQNTNMEKSKSRL